MSQLINLQLDKDNLDLSPGESVEVRATITNASDVVDAYTVAVTSLDPSWYSLSAEEVRLFPKDQTDVVVKIKAPAGGGAPAGVHAAPILVTSRNNPMESTVGRLIINLRPTGDFALGLEPAKIVGREGLYAVHLTNPGNSPITTMLDATDAEEALRYTLGAPKTQEGVDKDAILPRPPLGKAQAKRDGHIEHEIELPANSVTSVPLHVTTSKRIWIGDGKAVSLPFVVGAHPPGVEWEPKEAKKANAELSYKPIFGVLAALPMGLRRALGIAIPLLIIGLLIALLVTRTMQSQSDAAANARATQTAIANSANATQTALAAAGKSGAGGSPAMQTAQAAIANANATQTAIAVANGGNGVNGVDGLGGALFINDFRLKLPTQNDGIPVLKPNFLWDVTSAENVRITQTTRPLVIPKMETSKLVDFNLRATGRTYLITNTSSVLFVRPPAIEILAGNPLTVTLGQTTTLSWKVKAGAAALIDRVTVGLDSEGAGQVVEVPTMTRRYILCASNTAGSSCQAIKIWVVEGGGGSGAIDQPPSACAATAVDITIKGADFNAKAVTVGAGSTVRWVNQDGIPHNLTSNTGAGGVQVNSPLGPTNSYQYTFTAPGRYTYQLASDPTKLGVIVVLPPCTTTPSATPTRTPTRTPVKPVLTGVPTLKPTFTLTRTPTRAPVLTVTLTPTPEPTGYVPGEPIQPSTCAVGLVNVAMQSIAFQPRRVVIYAGSTIRWTNRDAVAHTSTSDANIWNSRNMAPGSTFNFTFNTVGGFIYHCNIHPTMKGIVVVIPPCAPTPTVTVVAVATATHTPRPPIVVTDTPEPPTLEPTREPTWTREPTREPTWTREPTREPTWTRMPTDTPEPQCPTLQVFLSAGFVGSVGSLGGSPYVDISWDSSGGCPPYTGMITGAYDGGPIHYRHTVGAPSGSDRDYPPQPSDGCTITYDIVFRDNSGQQASDSVSVESPWCSTDTIRISPRLIFRPYVPTVGEKHDVRSGGGLDKECVLSR